MAFTTISQEIARELYGISSEPLLAFVQGRASTKNVAITILKVVYPKQWPHMLHHVGEHFNTPMDKPECTQPENTVSLVRALLSCSSTLSLSIQAEIEHTASLLELESLDPSLVATQSSPHSFIKLLPLKRVLHHFQTHARESERKKVAAHYRRW